MDEKRITHTLISGTEALDSNALLKLFEFLKGRPASEAEIAELLERIAAA